MINFRFNAVHASSLAVIGIFPGVCLLKDYLDERLGCLAFVRLPAVAIDRREDFARLMPV